MSQEFVEYVSPRSGRKQVAHGVSRGFVRRSLTPAYGTPLPLRRERGAVGGGEGSRTQGLRPGLLYAAPGGASKDRRA